MLKGLTIGKLAHRAGVGIDTVRFYERSGLVRQPPRPASGFRHYPEETVARIRFIRQAQTLGFTLKEISGLLALRVTPGTDCSVVRTRAAEKLGGVVARIAEMERIRGALETLVAACPGSGALARCTILDALAQVSVAAAGTKIRRQRKGKDMKSLEVRIEGMHCDGCAQTVEALLAHEAGIKAAKVSYAAGTGRILYAPEATDPARIAAAIEKAGYSVTLAAGQGG